MNSLQYRAQQRRKQQRNRERMARLGTFVVDAVGLLALMALCLWVYAGLPGVMH